MQGLLELGKQLYEFENKKIDIYSQAEEYIKSFHNIKIINEEKQHKNDYYIYRLLNDVIPDDKINSDATFLNFKNSYLDLEMKMERLQTIIKNYKNCLPKHMKKAVYHFSNPYSEKGILGDNQPEERYIRIKNWKAFLDFYIWDGFHYSCVDILSKEEAKKCKLTDYLKCNGKVLINARE